MGGNPSTRTETTPTAAQIPPELLPLVRMAVEGTTEAMPNLPIGAFTEAHPQQIPNLTGQQMALINSMVGMPFEMQGALRGRPGSVPGPAAMPTLPMWASQAPGGFDPSTWRPRQIAAATPPGTLPQLPFTVDPNTGDVIPVGGDQGGDGGTA